MDSLLIGSSGDESRPEAAAGEDETGEFNVSFQNYYANADQTQWSNQIKEMVSLRSSSSPVEVVLNAYCKSSLISYRNYGLGPI